MAFPTECPHCKTGYMLDARYAGQTIPCAKCMQPFVVQLQNIAPVQPAPIPTAQPIAPRVAQPVVPQAATIPTAAPIYKTAPQVAAPAPPRAAAPPIRTNAPAPTMPQAAPVAPSRAEDTNPFANLGAAATSNSQAGTGDANKGKAAVGHRPQGRKKKINPLPIILGVSGLGLALIIGVIAALSMSTTTQTTNAPGGNNGTAMKSSSTMATVVLDWPESERKSGRIVVDSNVRTVPATGPVEIQLSPGKHQVGIMRRDYEHILHELTVKAGEVQHIQPEWKSNAPLASTTDLASNVKAASPEMSNTPSETTPSLFPNNVGADPNSKMAMKETAPAIPTIPGTKSLTEKLTYAPEGFEGWEQRIIVAREYAARDGKDVLVLFGSSDGSPATVRIGESLRKAGLPDGELGKKYEPVIIDFFSTREGRDKIFDIKQNVRLLNQFNLGDVSFVKTPVLVLLDSEGFPYAIEKEWEGGIKDVPARLEKMQAQKAVRDEAFTIANGETPERFAAMGKMADFIYELKCFASYNEKLTTWQTALEQEDPNNEKGFLEGVMELQFYQQFLEFSQQESPSLVKITRLFSKLDEWLERKFQNPDRALRLHFLAFNVLSKIGEEDQAHEHLARATTYNPTEEEGKEIMKQLKVALENKDILSSGTGFVVASDGYMLTNRHVIEGNGNIKVRIPNVKEPVPAELVKIHEVRDIALIKVQFPEDFKPEPISLSNSNLTRGLPVAAFGFPRGDVLGKGRKFSSGSISDLPNEELDNMLLLDVRINPGNSGGPLCDMKGNVIGMITAKTSGFLNDDSYGMAIPAAELKEFLIEHIPASATQPTTGTKTLESWDEVDQRVGSGVLMILKVKE